MKVSLRHKNIYAPSTLLVNSTNAKSYLECKIGASFTLQGFVMPSEKKASQTKEMVSKMEPMVPSKEQVLAARVASGLTQIEAAAVVHLRSFSRWSEYERGGRNMDAARFELFLIKTGQHPQFIQRKRLSRLAPSPLGQEDDAGNVPRSN